jgi:hypothetical protein
MDGHVEKVRRLTNLIWLKNDAHLIYDVCKVRNIHFKICLSGQVNSLERLVEGDNTDCGWSDHNYSNFSISSILL